MEEDDDFYDPTDAVPMDHTAKAGDQNASKTEATEGNAEVEEEVEEEEEEEVCSFFFCMGSE